jgi:hypothetical protein
MKTCRHYPQDELFLWKTATNGCRVLCPPRETRPSTCSAQRRAVRIGSGHRSARSYRGASSPVSGWLSSRSGTAGSVPSIERPLRTVRRRSWALGRHAGRFRRRIHGHQPLAPAREGLATARSKDKVAAARQSGQDAPAEGRQRDPVRPARLGDGRGDRAHVRGQIDLSVRLATAAMPRSVKRGSEAM